MKKNLTLITFIIMTALAGIIYFLFFYSRTLDTRDYIRIEFQGVNGNGRCHVAVDDKSLKKDITAAVEGDVGKDPVTLAGSSFFDEKDLFSVSCTPKKKLKNGDNVKVSVSFDNDRWKPYGFRFRCDTFNIKVKDLKKGKKFDPFSGYVLSVHGTAPFGYVKAEELVNDSVTFVCTPATNLKSGDKVVLEADENSLPEGVICRELSRTYQIGDMNTYIMQSADLSSKNRSDLQYDANKILKDPLLYDGLTPVTYHASSISKSGSDRQETLSGITINEVKPEEDAFLYVRQEEIDPVNIYIMPYKISFTKDGDRKMGFGALLLNSLIQKESGEITYKKGTGAVVSLPSTDIYFDRADLQKALLRMEKDFSPEMVKKNIVH